MSPKLTLEKPLNVFFARANQLFRVIKIDGLEDSPIMFINHDARFI